MDYLKEFGYNDLDIKDIENYNYKNIIDNLVLNQIEVSNVIRYLFEIGLEKDTIKDIFIKQVNLFFKTKNEIKESFDEYEIDSIVKSLNFDVNNIEMIDFI